MAKDSYYFTHDSNARHDPKIKALVKKYGIDGYGRFWIVIEMLRESANYKLEDDQCTFDALAEEMKCTEESARQFIQDCISVFKLLNQVENFFYSPALLERMIRLDGIRAKRKASADSRWEKEKGWNS